MYVFGTDLLIQVVLNKVSLNKLLLLLLLLLLILLTCRTAMHNSLNCTCRFVYLFYRHAKLTKLYHSFLVKAVHFHQKVTFLPFAVWHLDVNGIILFVIRKRMSFCFYCIFC